MNFAKSVGRTGVALTLGIVLALAAVLATSQPVLGNSAPDLKVNGFGLGTDRNVRAGSDIRMNASIRNFGDQASEATTVRFYRSSDATVTTEDTEVATAAVGSLGVNKRANVDVTVPAIEGTYYYGVCVDAVTGESDTTNNCFSSSYEVSVPVSASGAPTISGTAQVGQTLTASTTEISDTDGLTNVNFSYQWLADDTDIDEATNSSYEVQATDTGKVIKVRVTFTDDAGNDESLTSAGTSAVVLGGL